MSHLDELLRRNKDFAARTLADGTLLPSLGPAAVQAKAMIIGCVDMRVDPGDLFELEPGEALILRNVGGRITPGVIAELGMLGRIGQVLGGPAGGGGEFHLIVLHHTDCGITRLTGEPAMLSRFLQVPEADLPAKSVADPHGSVVADVAMLRAAPALPGKWLLSGLVYDVATGTVEIVVPPAPLRAG